MRWRRQQPISLMMEAFFSEPRLHVDGKEYSLNNSLIQAFKGNLTAQNSIEEFNKYRLYSMYCSMGGVFLAILLGPF